MTTTEKKRVASHRLLRIDVALLTLATALAACGGGGSKGPLPTPAASTTPVATATPAATPTPVPTPAPSAAPNPFPIAAGLAPGIGVAAAWGDDRYLVTFSDTTDREAPDVAGLRLTQDGQVVDSAPFLVSDFGSSPFLGPEGSYSPGGIAFAGGNFGVFLYGFANIPDGPPGEVVGFVTVPPDGSPHVPATEIDEQLSFSMAQTSLSSPIAVTTNGSLFLGIYQRIMGLVGSFSFSQVYGKIVTVTETGVTTQPVGPLSGILPPIDGVVTSGSAPGAAISATVTLVAWVETSTTAPGNVFSWYLQGALLTPDNATLVKLSDTAPGSGNVAVASDGTDFLVVWTATTASDPMKLSELRAVRVTSSGNTEPAGGFLIDGGGSAKTLSGIAFADGVYLVAWSEDGALRGARLGTAGDEAKVFTIDPGPAGSVALASDGARFLAVFERPNGSSSDLVGSFVPRE